MKIFDSVNSVQYDSKGFLNSSTSPDDTQADLHTLADENGFQSESDLLPVATELPGDAAAEKDAAVEEDAAAEEDIAGDLVENAESKDVASALSLLYESPQ